MATKIATEKNARDVAAGKSWTLDNLYAPVGAEATYAAGLVTVATLGVAVKNVAVTTARGDSNGITIGTDNTFTATFPGTRLVRVQANFDVDIASAADALTLHIMKNGVSVFETAAQTVTASTLKQYGIDVLLEMATGDYFEVWGENEDTTANIITAAYSDALDVVPSTGWLKITG